jgi:hypothetical protein
MEPRTSAGFCELPPQTLVDLLKHSLCVGEARRLVLAVPFVGAKFEE